MPRRSQPSSPSIAQVAKRAGVSIATVSYVVNAKAGRISAPTAERVRRAVAELGYRPNRAASALKAKQSRLIALLAHDLADPTTAARTGAFERAARQRGLVLAACASGGRAALQDEHLAEMRAQGARGVAVLAAVPSPGLRDAVRWGPPLAFVDHPPPEGLTAPYVGIDHFAAGFEIGRALRERGLSPVASIGGAEDGSATLARIAGLKSALAPHVLLEALAAAPGVDPFERGRAAAGALLETPRAIVCASDPIAHGAARALRERGFEPDVDIALIGFDDTPTNEWLAPWLSSVSVPCERIAEAAIAALEPDGASETIAPHSLVLRGLLARASPGGRR